MIYPIENNISLNQYMLLFLFKKINKLHEERKKINKSLHDLNLKVNNYMIKLEKLKKLKSSIYDNLNFLDIFEDDETDILEFHFVPKKMVKRVKMYTTEINNLTNILKKLIKLLDSYNNTIINLTNRILIIVDDINSKINSNINLDLLLLIIRLPIDDNNIYNNEFIRQFISNNIDDLNLINLIKTTSLKNDKSQILEYISLEYFNYFLKRN